MELEQHIFRIRPLDQRIYDNTVALVILLILLLILIIPLTVGGIAALYLYRKIEKYDLLITGALEGVTDILKATERRIEGSK